MSSPSTSTSPASGCSKPGERRAARWSCRSPRGRAGRAVRRASTVRSSPSRATVGPNARRRPRNSTRAPEPGSGCCAVAEDVEWLTSVATPCRGRGWGRGRPRRRRPGPGTGTGQDQQQRPGDQQAEQGHGDGQSAPGSREMVTIHTANGWKPSSAAMVYSPSTSARVRNEAPASEDRRLGRTTRRTTYGQLAPQLRAASTSVVRRRRAAPRPATGTRTAAPARCTRGRGRAGTLVLDDDERLVERGAWTGAPGPTAAPCRSRLTSAIGGTTSGSMQTTSTTGRSRGAPSRTATSAGTASSSTRTMVAAASPSESSRLSEKPSAPTGCRCTRRSDALPRGVHGEHEGREQRHHEVEGGQDQHGAAPDLRPPAPRPPVLLRRRAPWVTGAGAEAVGVSAAIGRSVAAGADRPP